MATDRQIAAYRVNEAGVSAGNSFLTKRTRQVQVSQGFRRSRVPILNLPKPRPNPVKPTGNPLKPKANPRKPRPTALTCNFPVNAVEFHRVSKTYRIYESPADRLRELAAFNRRSHHREFQALRDLSFTIRSGEVFCIVGENGSGKSTSLRLMAGIAEPTSGEVRTTGRVAALLELGAGFNPEFSGRENAYLNASILGLSKREIDARYRSIEEFAEIGDFIDQPVKTYSSGMAVRLAFAVAISVDPEILIVDEALAVGDTYFRHRCMRKVRELRSRGVTIVFVSHSIADVKAIGERVLWLRHGEAVAMGDTDTVIAQYLAEMTDQPVRSPRAALTRIDTIPNIDHRHGDGSATILGIAVTNEYNEPLHLMAPDSRVSIRITFRATVALSAPEIGFVLRNHLGLDFSVTSHSLPDTPAGGTLTVAFELEIPELYPGSFSFSPWLKNQDQICDWIDNAVTVQMSRGEKPVYGYIQWPVRVEAHAASTGNPGALPLA
jgi:ABC-type polysaccharide/polyol phosphate transport system ATPase subunit